MKQLTTVNIDDFTNEQLVETALNARAKTIENTLLFAACVYQLKLNADKKKGGSNFSKIVKERLGLSQPSANEWAIVGAKYSQLTAIAVSLPTSKRTLIDLTRLEPTELQAAIESKKVTPESTREDVQRYIEKLILSKTPPAPPQPKIDIATYTSPRIIPGGGFLNRGVNMPPVIEDVADCTVKVEEEQVLKRVPFRDEEDIVNYIVEWSWLTDTEGAEGELYISDVMNEIEAEILATEDVQELLFRLQAARNQINKALDFIIKNKDKLDVYINEDDL